MNIFYPLYVTSLILLIGLKSHRIISLSICDTFSDNRLNGGHYFSANFTILIFPTLHTFGKTDFAQYANSYDLG